MNRIVRIGLLAVLFGALGVVAAGLGGFFIIAPSAGGTGDDLVSSRQCAACHAEVYKEWESSWHAKAYVDPEVRKLSNDYANEQCIDCHAPRPVLETGIDKPPLPRAARRVEGVDCVACHANEGTMATASATAAGACAPRRDGRILNVQYCGTCHDQHFTVQEWRMSPFANDPKGCIACHMQGSARSNGRPGASHAFPASHDLASLKRVLEVSIEPGAEGLVVTVKNAGAGHHFPTDERSRACDVLVRWTTPSSQTLRVDRLDRYRSPYRDQPHESDDLPFREESPLRERRPASTLLPAGVARTYRATRPPEASGAEVIIIYKTIPFPRDPAAILDDRASFDAGQAFTLFHETVKF